MVINSQAGSFAPQQIIPRVHIMKTLFRSFFSYDLMGDAEGAMGRAEDILKLVTVGRHGFEVCDDTSPSYSCKNKH